MDDPIEAIVAEALDRRGIAYTRDDPLDFELDGWAIECKRFYTDRIVEQIQQRSDVVVIQGRYAAEQFAKLMGGDAASQTKSRI